MKSTALLSSIIAISTLAVSAPALAATYEIDPFHSNTRFAIDHFKTSTSVGGFYGLTGAVQFDAAKRTGSVDVRIPVSSLQTGYKEFTGHLLSADFFDVEQHPEMHFVSTKFNFSGKKLRSVDGQLTLLGQTHPVRLTANKFNCYDSPMLKAEVCGGDFSTTIDRSKWGMTSMLDMGVTKNVRLDIQIEAAKK